MKPKARLQYMHINKVVYNIVNTVPRYWNGLLNEIHVRNGKKKMFNKLHKIYFAWLYDQRYFIIPQYYSSYL